MQDPHLNVLVIHCETMHSQNQTIELEHTQVSVTLGVFEEKNIYVAVNRCHTSIAAQNSNKKVNVSHLNILALALAAGLHI